MQPLREKLIELAAVFVGLALVIALGFYALDRYSTNQWHEAQQILQDTNAVLAGQLNAIASQAISRPANPQAPGHQLEHLGSIENDQETVDVYRDKDGRYQYRKREPQP